MYKHATYIIHRSVATDGAENASRSTTIHTVCNNITLSFPYISFYCHKRIKSFYGLPFASVTFSTFLAKRERTVGIEMEL